MTHCLYRVLEIAGCRMFNPLLQPNALFRISKYYNQEQECIKILKATVTDVRICGTPIYV